MKTTFFTADPPYPPILVEYPEAWKLTKSSGQGYKEIVVIGPRNAENTFSVAFVLRFTQLTLPKVNDHPLQRVACRKLQAHVDQPQPPVEGLTGLRYRES